MIDGVTSRAFSAIKLFPPEMAESFKEEIVRVSRERYGTQREEVEKEILIKNQHGAKGLSIQRVCLPALNGYETGGLFYSCLQIRNLPIQRVNLGAQLFYSVY